MNEEISNGTAITMAAAVSMLILGILALLDEATSTERKTERDELTGMNEQTKICDCLIMENSKKQGDQNDQTRAFNKNNN